MVTAKIYPLAVIKPRTFHSRATAIAARPGLPQIWAYKIYKTLILPLGPNLSQGLIEIFQTLEQTSVSSHGVVDVENGIVSPYKIKQTWIQPIGPNLRKGLIEMFQSLVPVCRAMV